MTRGKAKLGEYSPALTDYNSTPQNDKTQGEKRTFTPIPRPIPAKAKPGKNGTEGKSEMASAFSSTILAASLPLSRGGPGRFVNLCLARPGDNRLLFKSLSSRKLVTRKARVIRGTVLRDQEEKVKAEESFKSASVGDVDTNKIGDDSAKISPSSDLESWVIKIEQSINIFLTDSIIKILDSFYHDRDYARFFVLETIARVPYFAFMSVLHMYESFGWWRRADYLKVHFAESWNEMHHLLIMEELGGNSWWFDRFLAQHIAFFYYIMTVVMYAVSPRMAYHFSECVESHAFSTYDKFLKAQGEELKKLPAPEVAVKYYTGDDLYLFDEFQTSRPPQSRRPKIENLHDVFLNIRDDEAEHCKTMRACQTHGNLRSPHSSEGEDALVDDPGCVLSQDADCEGIVDCIKKSVTTSPQRDKASAKY